MLDISVGKKDLQQCADAVIRLRAEYLYAIRAFDKIKFQASDGTLMDYESFRSGHRFVLRGSRLVRRRIAKPSDSRAVFEKFLETVFVFAGTQSLSKQLVKKSLANIVPGDVFIRGGNPGHAVIVVDVALNARNEKMFLLAQSYMPAQDIHILVNPSSRSGSPWYDLNFGDRLETPEWTFSKNELKGFPEN